MVKSIYITEKITDEIYISRSGEYLATLSEDSKELKLMDTQNLKLIWVKHKEVIISILFKESTKY